MARNRRNQPAAIRFGPVLKAMLICLVIVLCCVGYVWQKKQINLLSEQIKKSERRLADAREHGTARPRLIAAQCVAAPIRFRASRNQQLRCKSAAPRPQKASRRKRVLPP